MVEWKNAGPYACLASIIGSDIINGRTGSELVGYIIEKLRLGGGFALL